MEIVYVLGTVALMFGLIWGSLEYRRRNRAAVRLGEKIVEERYKEDQS